MNGKSKRRGMIRGLPVRQLAKGLFLIGMPGSGKTTALMNLVVQLHKQENSLFITDSEQESHDEREN